MVRVLFEFIRHKFNQAALDRLNVFSRRDAGAVGDTEVVRIDCNGRFAKRNVEHHVGSLAADAGQGFERFAGGRHFAAVLLNQHAAGGDDVVGLGFVEADGGDVRCQAFYPEREDGRRRAGHRVELAGGGVDTFVGGLGRQDHRDQQFEGGAIDQITLGMRRGFAPTAEYFKTFLRVHASEGVKCCLGEVSGSLCAGAGPGVSPAASC